jgi:acetyltransferase
MTIHHLDKLLHPRNIAVIGASDRPGSIGGAVLRNLIDSGFGGAVFSGE